MRLTSQIASAARKIMPKRKGARSVTFKISYENPFRGLLKLALQAADALWALAEGKEPETDPKAINQDIYDFQRRIGPILNPSFTEEEVLAILASVGAVITGSHIVYTKGGHGSAYVDKDRLYPHPVQTTILCGAIAFAFKGHDVDAVIAPEKGGIILSQLIAAHLCDLENREVLAFYAEKKDGGGFVIKRGGADKIVSGKRILVAEDILNTGGSVLETVEAVRAIGGEVVGVGVLINRGGVTAEMIGDVPKLFTLASVKLDNWNEDECPLCRDGVPINTEVGKGADFLARQHGNGR